MRSHEFITRYCEIITRFCEIITKLQKYKKNVIKLLRYFLFLSFSNPAVSQEPARRAIPSTGASQFQNPVEWADPAYHAVRKAWTVIKVLATNTRKSRSFISVHLQLISINELILVTVFTIHRFSVLSHPWLRTALERKCSFATRVRTGMFSHTCVRTPRRVLIG